MYEYPCSECKDHDRFRDARDTTIMPEDFTMLMDELRRIREAIEKLVEKE
jgi:hypothetical protein